MTPSLGSEEITADIPNVGEHNLNKLDQSGIVYIGAEVSAGDILVGKVTPKGETQLTPEEKLLRAIFGEKASDVKDTSLRVPSGMDGTVIDVQVFTRDGVDKDERAISIEKEQLRHVRKDLDDQLRIVENAIFQRLENGLVGKDCRKRSGWPEEGQQGDSSEYLAELDHEEWFKIRMRSDDANELFDQMADQLKEQRKVFDARFRGEERQDHPG